MARWQIRGVSRCSEPCDRRIPGACADSHEGRRERGRRGCCCRLSGLAPHPSRRPDPVFVQAEAAAGRARGGLGANLHPGKREDAGQIARVACGIPTLMQGYNLEDVASGIDEMMIRQPLGVTAAITPFNFPAMIPFWFLPYAIACGNTFILKASEKVPLTMQRAFELMEALKLPPGEIGR